MTVKCCIICGQPLNKSQYSDDHQYKSCPKCSVNNGNEHVYYKYPESFGTTPLRSTSNNPEGPQSYCTPCRGSELSHAEKVFCSELK